MEKYLNKNNDSGVSHYEIFDDKINVKFTGKEKIYTYSNHKAGWLHVDNMKNLAQKGSGLNSYINTNVKYLND